MLSVNFALNVIFCPRVTWLHCIGKAFATEISTIGYSVSISFLSLSQEVRAKAVTQKNTRILFVGSLRIFITIKYGLQRSAFRMRNGVKCEMWDVKC
ncbi:hypothetical protein D3C84_970950 [compost metagenome]